MNSDSIRDNNKLNNNTDTNTNSTTTTTTTTTTTDSQNILNDERFIFGDFFGMVPERYVKYFNLILTHVLFTIGFAMIYYQLLSNFDKNYVIQYGVSKPLFLKHRLWHAFFMSINFQTTTAYMPLNCKSLLSNLALNLQIIETFLITFLFLII